VKKEVLHPFLKESLEIKAMKPGLERMLSLDFFLGYPSRKFAAVHIAGTNGKGSVSTKIARALQANGKKVGLYTSPHIASFHERIQINGRPIPEQAVDRLLKKIVDLAQEIPSYFELLTLLAFCYFAEEKVDFAVIETGMGGRWDATNIILPVLSVITSIDFDHMAYLGNSLEAIAYEKAGIIKPGVPVLIGPYAQPEEVFEKEAERVKSPLFQVDGSFAHYEEENQAIARKALYLLPFPLEQKSIDIGLSAVPPCRFEKIGDDPLVILDAAHNPNGLKRVFERLDTAYPGQKVRVLAGFSADKAIQEATEIIQSHSVALHLTHTDHFRLSKLGVPLENAFEEAYLLAKKHQEILLVCGTFFIMDRARSAATDGGIATSGWQREFSKIP
jgi:dihydrofolate synthase / folylpolyglutamate synthase